MAKSTKTTPEMENMQDTEMTDTSGESRVYELGFHLDGELSQEESKKSYEAMKDLITKNGTVIAEGTPEKIQLAYTISRMDTTGRRDFNTAFFCWIVYEAEGPGHEAVTAAANADKRIIRFIDLRTTKEAAQHASEMHEFYLKVPEVPVEDDSAADAELDAALKEAGAPVSTPV
jgi:ribosomal protein S6